MVLKNSVFFIKNLKIAADFRIGTMVAKAAAYILDLFFGKLVVTGEFRKNLIIVSVIIETVSGNAISFAVLEFIDIKRNVISGTCFAFGVNSVAVIGVERNCLTFCYKIPFAVFSKNMEFEGIMEGKRIGAFVFPDAADACFIIKNIFILGAEGNIFPCFGIIRFRFNIVSASGKKENKTKQDQNNFFQNNASFQVL